MSIDKQLLINLAWVAEAEKVADSVLSREPDPEASASELKMRDAALQIRQKIAALDEILLRGHNLHKVQGEAVGSEPPAK